jgi:heterodisulfide reductase subunit A-like polyferredoxin
MDEKVGTIVVATGLEPYDPRDGRIRLHPV